jgi:hypothetical protein
LRHSHPSSARHRSRLGAALAFAELLQCRSIDARRTGKFRPARRKSSEKRICIEQVDTADLGDLDGRLLSRLARSVRSAQMLGNNMDLRAF